MAACAASLKQLSERGIKYESVFVDSASTDGSVEIARTLFDKVIGLESSPYLNAGAARHVGTQNCLGTWILYLDGDMELAPEILSDIAKLLQDGRAGAGLCGYTENIYPDGGREFIRFRGNFDGRNCQSFGGAVLLPRKKVLKAGNWSCSLYSYEETELYSRLSRTGVEVTWHERRMVTHKTVRVSAVRKLLGVINPYRSYLGKKFYGVGQVTRLTLRNGNFFAFARSKSEGYLMLISMLLGILGAVWISLAALWLPFAVFCSNAFRLGIKSAVNYTCWLPQFVFGLMRLRPNFRPSIHHIYVQSPEILSPKIVA